MNSGLASKVVVDTNSLIYSIEHRVNLRALLLELPEVKGIIVPECVHRELQAMSGDVKFALGALELSEQFERVPGEGYADDYILELAKKGQLFVMNGQGAHVSI